MSELIQLSGDGDYTSARYADLVIQIWHQETTLKGVRAFRKCVATISGDTPGGPRVLIVVEPAAALPPRLARNEIAAVMKDYRARIRASALAYEATGFSAASIRAVVTGLNLITHHPFPYRVFPSIPEALSWDPMTRMDAAASSLEAARVIRQYRAQREGLPIAS